MSWRVECLWGKRKIKQTGFGAELLLYDSRKWRIRVMKQKFIEVGLITCVL